VEPLMQALEPYAIWFTGCDAEQSPTRKNLKGGATSFAERQEPAEVSLLADWSWQQVWDYTTGNGLVTCHSTIRVI